MVCDGRKPAEMKAALQWPLTLITASLLFLASPMRASFWTWAVRAFPRECR